MFYGLNIMVTILQCLLLVTLLDSLVDLLPILLCGSGIIQDLGYNTFLSLKYNNLFVCNIIADRNHLVKVYNVSNAWKHCTFVIFHRQCC